MISASLHCQIRLTRVPIIIWASLHSKNRLTREAGMSDASRLEIKMVMSGSVQLRHSSHNHQPSSTVSQLPVQPGPVRQQLRWRPDCRILAGLVKPETPRTELLWHGDSKKPGCSEHASWIAAPGPAASRGKPSCKVSDLVRLSFHPPTITYSHIFQATALVATPHEVLEGDLYWLWNLLKDRDHSWVKHLQLFLSWFIMLCPTHLAKWILFHLWPTPAWKCTWWISLNLVWCIVFPPCYQKGLGR